MFSIIVSRINAFEINVDTYILAVNHFLYHIRLISSLIEYKFLYGAVKPLLHNTMEFFKPFLISTSLSKIYDFVFRLHSEFDKIKIFISSKNRKKKKKFLC